MSPLPNRYLGIDVLRGMTLALMIVVNMSISTELSYQQLLHATWNGFTLTDAVFPTFLFVVGAAMAFTLERYQKFGTTFFLGKISRRVLLIFLCGLLVSNFPFFKIETDGVIIWQSLGDIRILGVLQRIALAYCIAAFLIYFTGLRGALIYSLATLLGYWWVLNHFGDYSLAGNAARKLDMLILGATHLYKGEGIPFDPEGLLGTLPSVVNLLAGYAAVIWLRRRPVDIGTTGRLLVAGAVFLTLALLWNAQFTINKKLWTSSYVLCTVGIDLLILGALVLVIDIWGVRGGTRYFEVFGKNTLFIYVFAEILMAVFWTVQINNQPMFMWIYSNGFQWWAGGKAGSLLFAIVFAQFCWMIGYVMDKKRIYIRF